MEENVNIVGTGNLESWASEKTQKEMLAELKKHSDLSKEQLDHIIKSAKDGEDSDDVFESLLNDLNKTTEKTAKSQDKHNKSTLKSSGSSAKVKDSGKGFSTAQQALLDISQDKLPKISDMYNKSMKSAITNLDLFSATALVSISSFTKHVAKALFDSASQYADITRSGALFANKTDSAAAGLVNFTQSALDANLSISELVSITGEYTSALNQFGIQSFGKASKQIASFGQELGMSASEVSTYLAEYLEQQRMLGTLNGLTSAKAAKEAAANLENTKRFASALGQSVKEFQDKMSGQLKSVDMATALSNIPDEMSSMFRNAAAGMSDGASQALLQFTSVAEGQEKSTQAYRDLANSGQQAAADELIKLSRQFKRGTIAKGEELAAAAKAEKHYGSHLAMNAEMIRQAAIGGVQGAKELLLSAQESRANVAALAAAEEARARDVFAQTKTSWENTKKYFGNFFEKLNSEIVEKHGGVMSEHTERMAASMERLQPVMEKVITALAEALVPAVETLADGVDNIVTFIESMFDPDTSMFDVFTGLGTLLNNEFVYAALHLKRSLTNGIASVVDFILSSIGPNSIFGKLLAPFKIFGKILFGLATKIPVVGQFIGAFFGLFEGLGEAANMKSIWAQIVTVFESIIGGVFDSFLSLPKLLAEGFARLFMGKKAGDAVDKFYNDFKEMLSPSTWLKNFGLMDFSKEETKKAVNKELETEAVTGKPTKIVEAAAAKVVTKEEIVEKAKIERKQKRIAAATPNGRKDKQINTRDLMTDQNNILLKLVEIQNEQTKISNNLLREARKNPNLYGS